MAECAASPFIVNVYDPTTIEAVVATETVFAVPDVEGTKAVLGIVQVALAGHPEIDGVIEVDQPFRAVKVAVYVVDEPCTTEREVGERETEKSGIAVGGITCKVSQAEWGIGLLKAGEVALVWNIK